MKQRKSRSPKQIAHTKAMQAANVGRHPTPETTAKLRAAKAGNKHPWRGKRHALETIEKLRASAKIAHKRPEVRAKHSAAVMGDKNPRWLGGISAEPYGWNFSEELKEEVRQRDGHRCQLCGVPQMECTKKLPVHHIDYDKKNSDPLNLVALCVPCNSKVNANREHWTAYFQAATRSFKGRFTASWRIRWDGFV